MKRYFHYLIVSVMALGATAEEAPVPAFRMFFPSTMPEATVAYLQDFMDRSTDLPVTNRRYEGDAPRVAEGDVVPLLGTLVLVDTPVADEQEPLTVVTNRVGTLRLARLKTKDEEVYLRRIGRHMLRLAGELAELPECPLPRCARSLAIDRLGVDALGVNTCPPCRMRLIQKAEARGSKALSPLRFMPAEVRQRMLEAQKKKAP